MRASRRLGPVVLAAALALPPMAGVARAGAPTEQLRGQIDRVVQILDDASLRQPGKAAERRDLIRKAAAQIFDYAEIAKRCIGPRWQSGTQAERDEVVRLFGELLERTWVAKLELYSGERVQFTGEQVDDGLAWVRTRIVTRNDAEIPVDYRMLRRDDRWVIYDVAIEGVSLVANYRTQFNKILQTGSFSDLVMRLRAKIAEPPHEAPRIQPAASR